MLKSVVNFLKREDGPTAVEYAVMLALIIVVCLTAIQAVGTNAKTTFTSGMLAPYWLFMLGGLFIAVTLLLPRGIVGTVQYWMAQRRAHMAAGEDTAGNGGAANGTANPAPRPAE